MERFLRATAPKMVETISSAAKTTPAGPNLHTQKYATDLLNDNTDISDSSFISLLGDLQNIQPSEDGTDLPLPALPLTIEVPAVETPAAETQAEAPSDIAVNISAADSHYIEDDAGLNVLVAPALISPTPDETEISYIAPPPLWATSETIIAQPVVNQPGQLETAKIAAINIAAPKLALQTDGRPDDLPTTAQMTGAALSQSLFQSTSLDTDTIVQTETFADNLSEINIETPHIDEPIIEDGADIELSKETSITPRSKMDIAGLASSATPATSGTSSGLNLAISPLTSAAPITVAQTNIAAGTNLKTTLLSETLQQAATQSVGRGLVQAAETQKGVTVRLNPPEMGRVYIEFQFDADRSVTAILQAERPEMLPTLRENSQQLQQMLREQGFNEINLSFSEKNFSDQHSFDEPTYNDMDLSAEDEAGILASDPNIGFTRATMRRDTGTASIDIKL